GEASVRSPLPGKIIDLRVKAGDTVSKGQPLLVLEAMKMEHTLAAPADGKIKSVRYAVGEQVAAGAELVEFEESCSRRRLPWASSSSSRTFACRSGCLRRRATSAPRA